MKLSNKAVEQLVKEVAGSDVLPLVELIKSKENVSEFKLADKLNLTINQIRNMLYRLYNHNIVYFTRKKDKKKGWYIYFWSFNNQEAKNVLNKIWENRLNNLRKMLENEREGNFFVCPDKDVRLKFESAMDYDFKCPECGKVLEQEDNVRRVESIKKQIKELKREIEEERKFEENAIAREARRAAKKKSVKKRVIKRRSRKPPRKRSRGGVSKRAVSKRKSSREARKGSVVRRVIKRLRGKG